MKSILFSLLSCSTLLLSAPFAVSSQNCCESRCCNGIVSSNPVLPGFHADPEILYSQNTGKYYIYSTTDGTPGWGGHYFHVFSSDNLCGWKDEGIMLDLKGDQDRKSVV